MKTVLVAIIICKNIKLKLMKPLYIIFVHFEFSMQQKICFVYLKVYHWVL